jgi:hypothetical protein
VLPSLRICFIVPTFQRGFAVATKGSKRAYEARSSQSAAGGTVPSSLRGATTLRVALV